MARVISAIHRCHNAVDAQIVTRPMRIGRLFSPASWLLPEHFVALGGTALSVGYVNGQERTGAVQNLYLAAGLPLPQRHGR